jgi:cytochrome b561
MVSTASTWPSHYSAFSRTVHWLTVLLIAGMFYTGFTGFGKPKPGADGRPGGPPGAIAMRAEPAAPGVGSTPAGVPTAGLQAREIPADPGGSPGGKPRQNPFSKTSLHKAMGFTILVLAAMRIIYRLISRDRFPELPSDMPAWQIGAARGVQGLLYIGLLAQPLSGWLGSGRAFSFFSLFTLPAATFLTRSIASGLRYVHTHLDWVLIGLIGLHTLGAFYHHYVRKDNTLMSMIRGA